MSVALTRPNNASPAPTTEQPSRAKRVLVVYREGGRGEAALREAAELAAAGAELTVVTLAPQAKPLKCCRGGGSGPYNCAINDAADDELQQARTILGSLASRASFTKLIGVPWPPLADWAAARSFDIAIVPRARFARGGGLIARELRTAANSEIRLAG